MESLGGYFIDADNSRSRRMVLHDHLLDGDSWNINRNKILQLRGNHLRIAECNEKYIGQDYSLSIYEGDLRGKKDFLAGL